MICGYAKGSALSTQLTSKAVLLLSRITAHSPYWWRSDKYRADLSWTTSRYQLANRDSRRSAVGGPQRHQLFGIRQNGTVVIRAIRVNCAQLSLLAKSSTSATGFRRQFWTREGIGDAIDVCRSAFFHMPHIAALSLSGLVRVVKMTSTLSFSAVLFAGITVRVVLRQGPFAGDGHYRFAVSARNTVVFRRRGGQFRITNVYRCIIIDDVLAVKRIAAGNNKCGIAHHVTGAIAGGNGQRDTFPALTFGCF